MSDDLHNEIARLYRENDDLRARLAEVEAERDEWQRRAEMVWRQRDAADRRAAAAEDRLAEVEALCDRMRAIYKDCPPSWVDAVRAAARGENDRK